MAKLTYDTHAKVFRRPVGTITGPLRINRVNLLCVNGKLETTHDVDVIWWWRWGMKRKSTSFIRLSITMRFGYLRSLLHPGQRHVWGSWGTQWATNYSTSHTIPANNVGSSLLQVSFFVHTLPVVFWMSEWSRHQPIHLPGRNKQNKHLEHKYNYSLRFNCFPVIFFRKYSNRFPGAAEGLNEWKDIRWFLMMIGGRSTA